MCLAVISFQDIPGWPVLVAANRDESYRRASEPPSCRTVDRVTILAPRDRVAGGTWMGVNHLGIFAVITNRTDLGAAPPPPGSRSRGLLVASVLGAASLEEAHERVSGAADHPSAPYNLIFGDSGHLWFTERTCDERPSIPDLGPAISDLGPGVHIVSNHGTINDLQVGEIRRAREYWDQHLETEPWQRSQDLLALNREQDGLPPICKDLGDRGTVSSTILGIRDVTGDCNVRVLHRDGAPDQGPHEELWNGTLI